jgi:arylformamidase
MTGPTRIGPQLTAEDVERGYNNRAAVPDHPAWFARWDALSDAARAALGPEEDVRYGPNPKETLDIFLPPSGGARAPRGSEGAKGTFVFIHGGYWRALDKRQHAFVAPVFAAAGYAVAVVNYDLCPDVSIATIVGECRRAIAWIVRSGAAHGLDPANVVVAGHSAGGHLVAMLHATDWREHGLAQSPIAAGVSLSGVHDLAPLVQFSFNADFRLDEAEAARLSPIHLQPTTSAPLLIAVGADETGEFLRQSDLLWDAWPAQRPAGMQGVLRVPGRHHFNVVLDYAEPGSELTRQTLALLRGRSDASRGVKWRSTP